MSNTTPKESYHLMSERIYQTKESLKYSNRFAVDEKFNSLLYKCLEQKKTIIKKGQILYRARIYLESDKYEKYHNYDKYAIQTFAGYDKQNSFVKLSDDWNEEGRMNPAGIKYLYTSYDINTCLVEIKPYGRTLVSVAEIEVKEDLKTVDFSSDFAMSDIEELADFSLIINNEIGRAYNENGDYILSQYVAEFCKNNGFEAMSYRSSFNSSGKNVTIFNYPKCEAINSKLVFIEGVLVKSTTLELSNNEQEH